MAVLMALLWTTGSKPNRRYLEQGGNGRPKQREGLSVDRDQALAYRDLGILGGCILALPVLAVLRRFRWAAILTVIVLLECGVLGVNAGRCPLTDLATKYTADRASNFDIYLPNWLAEHNKLVFGLLFVAGELVVLGCWLRQKFTSQLS
ncbi:MAG TPA: hypothetical protein VEI52_03830 [Terriglobales bacterium]|nr:hypothetical protein [Terriglobales bacterium]